MCLSLVSLPKGIVAILATLSSGVLSVCNDPLSVNSPSGILHGTIDKATPSVRQFLGIPYAQPPIGELRFQPPQPAKNFGELDVKELPPSCMQALSPGAAPVLEFNLQGLNTTGEVDEDCLTLSVWAPVEVGKAKDAGWPVLIFVYGGAFLAGGQDVPYQIPAEWVQRTQDHIVVTFNYRLGVWGFPTAASLSDSNLALLDQRLVIEWVRDNIASFGGDPTRITLWGQSAGAIAVGYYAYAYSEDPIVTGLIFDSGNEFTFPTQQSSDSEGFTLLAERLNCGNLSSVDELACVRKVPAETLQRSLRPTPENPIPPFFFPVVDEKLIFSNYDERALAGRIAKIPAIIGINEQEVEGFGALIYFCTSQRATINRLAAGVETFRYEYHGNFSNISPNPSLGAYHSSELPMIFGTHPLFRGNFHKARVGNQRCHAGCMACVRARQVQEITTRDGLAFVHQSQVGPN